MNIFDFFLAALSGAVGALLLQLSTLLFLVVKDILQARRWSKKYPMKESPWKPSEKAQGLVKPEEEEIVERPVTTKPLEELVASSLRTKHTLHRIELARIGQGTSPTLPAIRFVRNTEGIKALQ